MYLLYSSKKLLKIVYIDFFIEFRPFLNETSFKKILHKLQRIYFENQKYKKV